MKYQAIIGKILNVHPKDLRTVMPMLVLIFFAGLGLSSAFNSINVALIKNQGAHSLPQIYIISGILLSCFSYLYALLEQKLGPAKLLSWVLVSIGIWALGTFAMFQYGTNDHLYIIGYVGYFLAYYLFNLLFWGVAALIFSTRQSKYVFSLLTGGESIAKIIGYSLTPLIIYKFNLNYGFIVSGISFLMAWPIWIYVRKKVHFSHVEHELHSQALHHNPMQQIVGSLKSMPFFKSIAVFSFLSMFIFYLVHYAFLTEVEATFEESSTIAIFFGAVYGLGKFINFGIKGLATSRLIKALGIYRVLLILPVMMFAIHLFGFLCSFSLGMETHLLLWVFTLSILADEFIRSSILKPTFLVLFQPLAKNLRLIGHTIAKGIMEPVGMLLAGLITLVFLNSLEISLSVLNLVILGFLALWIFTTKQLKTHYKNIILKALERRILPSDANEILLQPEVRSSLNKQLKNSNSLVEFISILKLLNRPILEKEKDKLHYFLESKKLSDDDKLLSLDFLADNCGPELWPLLKKWMISSNGDVQEKAIDLLCEIDPEKIEKDLKHFQQKDPKLYRVLIGNLLKTGDLNIAIKYGPKLIELLSSIDSENRLNGLEILSISDRKDYYQPLLKLLSDSNRVVRIKAIDVAGQFKSRKLIQPLIRNLKSPFRSYAEQSLITYGNKVLPELFKYFNANSSDKMMMFRMLGEFESSAVNKYIFEKLDGCNLNEKRAAFKALASTSTKGIKDQEHEKIVLDEMSSLRNTIVQLGLNKNEAEVWNEAVKTEIKAQLEATLHLVVILNGKEAIGDSIDQLYWGTADTISNTIERIESTVDYKTRKEIIPLFEKIYVYRDYPEGKKYTDLPEKVLSEDWKGKISQWLTAVAIRSNKLSKLELLKRYPHLLEVNAKIVKEEIESYHE